MAKVKILKKLPKSKKVNNIQKSKIKKNPQNKFVDSYLSYYDDIKVPGRIYDW